MQKTILVIEDERILLDAIKFKLERSGFNVVSASTVSEALHCIKKPGSVDAIWLDHYLSGEETGLDIIKKCKEKNFWAKELPIFVISNTETATKAHLYLELGATKYFTKVKKRLDEIVEEIRAELKMS